MSKTTATKAPTKRTLAEAIFNAELPNRIGLGNKIFRRNVRATLFADLDVSDAATVSLYNHAKKAAVLAGLTVDFGRVPKVPVVEAEAEVIVITPEDLVGVPVIAEAVAPKGAKWTVTATDGEVIFFASRAKARAEANGGTVAKIEVEV